MPNATVKKVSKLCDKSIEEVEHLFVQAEKLAEEQDKKGNYSYIMGIFKKSLGSDCLKKLNWVVKESDTSPSKILSLIQELINSNRKIKNAS